MADSRKLEPVRNNPGIYRKHANGWKRGKSCGCPYVVRWKAGGRSHKQFFPTLDLARECKDGLSGKVQRRPLSAKSVAAYWREWFPRYRGRTRRGLTKSTRSSVCGELQAPHRVAAHRQDQGARCRTA